jgi:hypothetical protein
MARPKLTRKYLTGYSQPHGPICLSLPKSRRFIMCQRSKGRPGRLRPNRKFPRLFKLILAVQFSREKYSALRDRKSVASSYLSRPARGAYRDRHGRWAWDAMDAAVSGAVDARTNDTATYGEVAWSWRPDAGAKSRRAHVLRGDGGKRARSPRRARISRKTVAQGRPDDPPVPVVLPRAFCCTRTMGAVGTRPSLRPPDFEGGSFQ